MSLPQGYVIDNAPSGLPQGYTLDEPKKQTGPDWLRGLVENDPNTTYGNILPLKTSHGHVGLALPETFRGLVRGAADMMDTMQGRYQPESSDSQVGGSLEQPLTPDAMGALANIAMMKPSVPTLLKNKEANVINKNLAMGDVTPQQFGQRLAESSPDDFAGELGGEPLRILTQTQAKIPTPAMQEARDAMRARLANAPQRTQGILEQAFGPQYNIDDATGTIAQLRSSEGDLYKSANGSIPRSSIEDVIGTPAGQKAIQQAGVNIQNRMGAPAFDAEAIPINQAHEIAKALGDQIPRNPMTGAMAEPATGAPIESLRKNIIGTLQKQSPEFDFAQTVAGESRGFEDAMRRGRSLAKMVAGEKTDDVLDRISLNEQQQPYSVAGFHQGLIDQTRQVPIGTGNPAGKIGNQVLLDKTTELVGADKAKTLGEALVKEKSRMDLANRALYGSNTPETLGQMIPDLPVSPIGMKFSAINKVKDAAEKFLSTGSNKRLAEALYASSPKDKAALTKELLSRAPKNLQQQLADFLRGQIPLMPQRMINESQGSQ